MKVLVYSELEN